jgi:hypothetical protein
MYSRPLVQLFRVGCPHGAACKKLYQKAIYAIATDFRDRLRLAGWLLTNVVLPLATPASPASPASKSCLCDCNVFRVIVFANSYYC